MRPHAARRYESARASLVAHEAVSRAHTRTPAAGWPAASTTTPLIAPTPVVSCAAADAETRVSAVVIPAATRARTGNRARNLTRSPYASAEAYELLLVCVVVSEDESPRADDRGVAFGPAPACPQFDIAWQVADDRSQLLLPHLACRRRRQSEHQHLGTCGLHALDNIPCGKIRPEIRNAEAAAGRKHRRAKRADLVAVARGGGTEQPDLRIRLRVKSEERAEDVP